jgi:hypothetical protein
VASVIQKSGLDRPKEMFTQSFVEAGEFVSIILDYGKLLKFGPPVKATAD